MKKVIFMESFAAYPNTVARTNTSVLEDAVSTYTPIPAEYGYLSPMIVINQSYSSRSSYIGSLTVDGTTYRGLIDTHGSYYGHVSFTVPKLETGSNKRLWVGCRISSNKFKTDTPFVTFYGSASTAKPPATGEGSYYIEVAVDAKTQQYYIYRNKELVQTMAWSSSDKTYIPQGKVSMIYMGACSSYGQFISTGETCYSDVYIAMETWDTDEAPTPAPYGPISVVSRKVTKVNADSFSTNNTSKEAAVQQLMEPTVKLTPNPLFTDSNGTVGTFEFEQKNEAKAPIAYQVSMSARRGVSSIGKLVSTIKDGTTTTTLTNEQPPLQTNASIPTYTYCSSTKLDGSALDAEYINKLSVEAHSEEG